MRAKFSFLFTFWLFLFGCQQHDEVYVYCGFFENDRPEKLYFNFTDSTIYGNDAVYSVEVVENDVARGFLSPFPIALPKQPISEIELPAYWSFANYTFTASQANPLDPDWIVIHARTLDSAGLEENGDSMKQTSVLYSASDGVLAIRKSTTYEEMTFRESAFACGEAGFSVRDLATKR